MTQLSPTHAALLAALLDECCERPGDVVVRGVYFDAAAESGEPGLVAQAELFSVQRELATFARENEMDEDGLYPIYGHGGDPDCKVCPWLDELRRRERELHPGHEPLLDIMEKLGYPPDGSNYPLFHFRKLADKHANSISFQWHLGFPDALTMPLEAWAGRTCERCGDRDRGNIFLVGRATR